MTPLDEVRLKLEEAARSQTTIHYGDIAPILKLDMENPGDRSRIGDLLGQISEDEHKAGRPLLSVVVTRKEDQRPGPGFFDLAKRLGLMSTLDKDTFFVYELKRTHKEWAAKPSN